MSEGWHYAEGAQTVGPMSLDMLTAALGQRPNAHEVLVWRAGFEGWRRAGDVPEVAARLAPASSPPLPLPEQSRLQSRIAEPRSSTVAQAPDVSLLHLWFSFAGRTNRAKYWLISLVNLFAIMLVAGAAAASQQAALWIIAGLLVLVAAVSGLAIGAKRLHDRDKSAWWLLIFYLLPNLISGAMAAGGSAGAAVGGIISLGIGIWAFVELGCLRGTEGPNRFGPDPLGHASP